MMENKNNPFNNSSRGGVDVLEVSMNTRDKKGPPPFNKKSHESAQNEQIFKNTAASVENALRNCIRALKDFRPDFDFSPVGSKENDIKVVKKNFKNDTITNSLMAPTFEAGGFSGVYQSLHEISSFLEGGIRIDISGVTKENLNEAYINIQHYQDKLMALQKFVKHLDSVIQSAALKFQELKARNSYVVAEKKFDDSVVKDAKIEIIDIKKELSRIDLDLSEGVNMLAVKFEGK